MASGNDDGLPTAFGAMRTKMLAQVQQIQEAQGEVDESTRDEEAGGEGRYKPQSCGSTAWIDQSCGSTAWFDQSCGSTAGSGALDLTSGVLVLQDLENWFDQKERKIAQLTTHLKEVPSNKSRTPPRNQRQVQHSLYQALAVLYLISQRT
eukprot:134103-Rhodomonas_salina.1